MRKFSLSVWVILSLLWGTSFPLAASAQTTLPPDPASASPSLPEPQPIPNTTNCFDDYHFGSVQADISPSVLSTVPGVPLTFSGTLSNDNPYPIVDGAVYVKIFKKQTGGKDADLNSHQNGPEVVDQFFAKENLSIKAKGSEPILFTWNIPRNMGTGDYQAATYFVTAQRFNLSGLSFTDDVTGNQADFSIKSDTLNPPVSFNKNTVTLNNQPHKFAIFPLHFQKDENVTATAELTNPSNQDKTIPLTWKLYYWDGLREENKQDEKTETITLKANETKKVSYTINKDTGSVAYLTAEAKDGASKSILDIRFVRDGIENVRLNFPSITSYPLTQGKENSLFSCVHSTNTPRVTDNTLTLTLKTLKGETIHQYTYQGDISGEMMGVKEAFTPDQTIQDFTLTATLKHQGQVVEEVTQTYLCNKLGENCPKETLASSSSLSDSLDFGERNMWLKLILFLVGAVLLFFIIRRIVTKRSNRAFSFFLALIIASSLLFGLGEVRMVEAAITTPSIQPLETTNRNPVVRVQVTNKLYADDRDVPTGQLFSVGSANISIQYHVDVTDISDNTIPNGANVPIGSQLKFKFIPHNNADIFWFGTGFLYDSPYGRWIAGAKPPTELGALVNGVNKMICDPYDRIDFDTGFNTAFFVPFSVNPPTKTPPSATSTSPNLTCGIPDANNDVLCTVTATAAGPISAKMVFNNTYARFYYRYYLMEAIGRGTRLFPVGCYGNNIPLSPNGGQGNPGNVPSSNSPFTIPIPAQTINFNFNAVPANKPPTKPTLTGDTSGAPNQLLNFTASNSIDPEGNDIRYIFDFHWDGDNNDSNNPFPFAPPSPYIQGNSGVYPPYSTTYSWPLGTYKVRVRAEDTSVGNYSEWSDSLTVTISDGACGSANGVSTAIKPSSNLCSSGSASVVSGGSGSPWTWNCLGPNNTTTNDDASCSAPFQDLNNCKESYEDTLHCCEDGEKTRTFSRTPPSGTLSCIVPPSTSIPCTSSEKNSCRDFNWKEVAP